MKTVLDTNVVSALLGGEHNVHAIGNSLQACKLDGPLLVSPVVYAELFAYPGMTEEYLIRFLKKTGLEIEYRIDQEILAEAGRRYARYAHRRRTSTKSGPRRLLADFVIGVHAVTYADRLMTSIQLYSPAIIPSYPSLHPPSSSLPIAFISP